MKSLAWSVLAIILGAVAAFVMVMAIEILGAFLYHLPPGLDPSKDQETLKAYVATLPPGAFLFLLAAWAFGTFAGAMVAAWLAPCHRLVHGLIISELLLAAGIYNLVTLPHPIWVSINGGLLFLPAACLGVYLAPSKRQSPASAAGNPL
jgi:hypothetical protein